MFCHEITAVDSVKGHLFFGSSSRIPLLLLLANVTAISPPIPMHSKWYSHIRSMDMLCPCRLLSLTPLPAPCLSLSPTPLPIPLHSKWYSLITTRPTQLERERLPCPRSRQPRRGWSCHQLLHLRGQVGALWARVRRMRNVCMCICECECRCECGCECGCVCVRVWV